MTGRDQMDAVAYWRQFPVTAHFLEPMSIEGTLIELAEHRARDEIIPKLRIQQQDGTVVIVIVGQTRLQAELAKHRPAVGDRITITYTGEAARAAPGMNRTKEFTVTVQRPSNGTKPAPAPAAPPAAKAVKVPTPVPEPVVDLEFQKVVAARLAVSERLLLLPLDKREVYRNELVEAALPENPAERSVEDCDRIWEILDKLGCPPLQDKLGDEPF